MLRTKDRLSDAEVLMFTQLGLEYLLEAPIGAVDFYEIAVRECFLDDKRGEVVESLRRTYFAIKTASVSRLTPEFDALIQLSAGK